MNYIFQVVSGLGVLSFLVGLAIRLFSTGSLLHASAAGWWRASVALLLIGILLALVQIRNELRSK